MRMGLILNKASTPNYRSAYTRIRFSDLDFEVGPLAVNRRRNLETFHHNSPRGAAAHA